MRRGLALALFSVIGCTTGSAPEFGAPPSRWDTRKHRHQFVVTPAQPIAYLNSLMRRAVAAGCSAGVYNETAIIDCHDEFHFELGQGDAGVLVACSASSLLACKRELARIEAVPDPQAQK